uniref:NAD-binding domain-containing protein n=2 Tax=Toxoplasma gondii TaxID=5811 RepID=A0A0F7UUD5_TOXGV|nr:TPA: NAD-binding domain-containing protein [Toxoplasma gondii VEG]
MEHSSMIQAFYPHQTLLVTGASGFVGKVLLAQLLKSCPVKKLYVLLRPSAGRSAQERLLVDVFSSPAFDEMRNAHQYEGGWNEWISKRVVAVPGDLLKPDFGIQHKHVIRKLQEEVTVVIHLAASVHFNSPLKDNYRSNVEGTMRILEFAKGCPFLQVFVHTSTCYVNSDHEGRVKEDILPLSWDTEELLAAVHKMIELRDNEARYTHLDVANLEKQLLGRFPNTYTFTKRLSEALLIRDWEKALLHPEQSEVKFPLCMLRPSIVGAAYQHPRRGWIDNLNATGGMFLLCALGVLKCLPANPNLIGDNVPVDTVADALIVSGAAVAAAHAYANPSVMKASGHPAAAASLAAAQCVMPQYLPHAITLPKNISPASSELPSPTTANSNHSKTGAGACEPPPAPHVYVNLLYKHVLNEPYNPPPFLARLIPCPDAFTFLKNTGPLPCCPSPWSIENAVLGSKAVASVIRKDAIQISKQGKRRRKNGKAAGTTQPEVEAEVRGDAQDLYDRIAGTIRPPAVYILGGLLHTAFLRLFDRIVVESTEVERLRKTVQESHGPVILLPTHRSYMDSLLLFYMCLGNGMPLPFVAADENLAQIAIINRLLRNSGTFFLKKPVSLSKSQTKSPSSRLYYTVVHQYIQAVAKRHGYLEFFIEGGRSKTGLLSRPQNGILRSVLDLYFDFEQPNVTFVPITISYDKVLEADSFPQELLGGHRKKEDLRRVLNVIRCMSCYGQDCKIQGTDSNGLQQRFGLGSKPLGSAYIKIAEPTTFKEKEKVGQPAEYRQRQQQEQEHMKTSTDWLRGKKNQPQNEEESEAMAGQANQYRRVPNELRQKLTADFADHLMGNLSSNLIVSPTSLVATILCMHRNGIREEDLEDQVQWLRDQVLLRGGLLSPGVGGLMFDMRLIVQAALQTYLRGVVASSGGGWSVIQSVAPGAAGANGVSGTPSVGDLTMKRPSTVGGTVVGPLGADAPRLVLAYYRNECCHLFILEAIVCAALFAFGHETAWEEGADSTALTEKAVFLMELLKDHFALKSQMREGEILKIIDLMVSRGILRRLPSPSASPSQKDDGGNRRYVFHPSAESNVTLFAYFVWPFVDSYWACGMGLFTLQRPPTSSDIDDMCDGMAAEDGDSLVVSPRPSRTRTRMSKAQLVARAHWLADGLYRENYVQSGRPPQAKEAPLALLLA